MENSQISRRETEGQQSVHRDRARVPRAENWHVGASRRHLHQEVPPGSGVSDILNEKYSGCYWPLRLSQTK